LFAFRGCLQFLPLSCQQTRIGNSFYEIPWPRRFGLRSGFTIDLPLDRPDHPMRIVLSAMAIHLAEFWSGNTVWNVSNFPENGNNPHVTRGEFDPLLFRK
jgi:hypothetical protein